MKFTSSLLVVLFLCTDLCAQDTTIKESISLIPITVKSRKKTEKERAAFQLQGQSTEALTETELNRNNSAFIEHSLNTIAGVQLDKRTLLGGQRIIIRGYGNDQKFNNWGIKAYYNDIPITSADGITLLDDIDFSLVNNVEVIKGPATTLYGGGVGGVARFNLKTNELKGTHVAQKINTGSFGLFQTQTRIDLVSDKGAIVFNYGHIQADGYRPRGASNKNTFSLLGNFTLNEKEKIKFYASHSYSHEELTGQIPYADYYAGIDRGNLAYAKQNARNELLTTRFSITHDYAFNKYIHNISSFFYSNTSQLYIAAGALHNNNAPNMGFRSVFTYEQQSTTKFINQLSFGTELQGTRTLGSRYAYPSIDTTPFVVLSINKASYAKTSTDQFSIFLQDRIKIMPLQTTVIVGMSVNPLKYKREDLLAIPGLLSSYNKDLSFKKNFELSYNPHIAIQKTIKNQIINLSYSEGFNAPTASTSFINVLNITNDKLLPEKAKMLDLSVQGLLFDTRFDYQFSIFTMNIENKLTQLAGSIGNSPYTYWANTGIQQNKGVEMSMGYNWQPKITSLGWIKKIEPFLSMSYNQFKYAQFKTSIDGSTVDFSGKQVVGVPKLKYTLGLDIQSNMGVYTNATYYYMGDVYADFANSNLVKGFTQLNAKIGYQCKYKNADLDLYVGANNMTNQINYTFLFLGNNVNDNDPGNGYANTVSTDLTPGAYKLNWWGGITFKYYLKN